MRPWRASRRKLSPRCNEADAWRSIMDALRSEGVSGSLLIALAFAAIAGAILSLRPGIVGHRPGELVTHDVVARAEFDYFDASKLEDAKSAAAAATPRVFRETRQAWAEVQQSLLALPDRVKGRRLEDLGDAELSGVLDNAALGRLQEYAEQSPRTGWDDAVRAYVADLRQLELVVIDEGVYKEELDRGRQINVLGVGMRAPRYVHTPTMGDAIYRQVEPAASKRFTAVLWPKVASLTRLNLAGAPTYELDTTATQQAENAARAAIPQGQGSRHYARNQPVLAVKSGDVGRTITDGDYALLKAENAAYRGSLGERAVWLDYLGALGLAVLVTAGGCAYIWKFAPRVVRNHARGLCLAALLLGTLLIAQLTAVGPGRLYFGGVAPTVLVAMVLAIGYDGRFAIGMAVLHAILVTVAVGQTLPFLVVLVAGSAVCCFAIDDLRSRSRLIEIGGLTGLALMAATAFAGMVEGDAFEFVLKDALFAAAAGLTVGFVVLGILPFVERMFRITTSMTLLELADTGHSLLRKLAQEAPGTYNHSMQVATLAEEACEAIGARALLARVGAYYHDVGKMNKPDYFIENQTPGQPNRHMTLSPNVSMLIITGHVKDGVELAREYNLPTALFPFIQSHHGTTLVEYFYRRAVEQRQQQRRDAASGDESADVPEHQYRYPGPRPRSKEVAVVMLADAVESICRTLDEPTASRIEAVVGDVVLKRLVDGQFDECDVTIRELALIEKSLVRTLLGIYHARIAYPSQPQPATEQSAFNPSATTQVRTA